MRVVISKEHLQSYIWVAPLLFQEATLNNILFSRVQRFFEQEPVGSPCFKGAIPVAVIHSINDLLFPVIKMQLQPRIFWRQFVIWRHQLPSIFSMLLSLFHGSTLSDPLCQGHCLYSITFIAATHCDIKLLCFHKMPKIPPPSRHPLFALAQFWYPIFPFERSKRNLNTHPTTTATTTIFTTTSHKNSKFSEFIVI